MRLIAVLACGIMLLSACSTPDKYTKVIAASKPPSPALKAQIVAGAKTLLYDPTSVKDAEISNVATFPSGTQGVCVRADSKNVKGIYVGPKTMGLAMRDGKLIDGTLEHPICNRDDVPWQPFPELNALGTPAKAKPRK